MPAENQRFVGLALEKECHSYFDMDFLRRLVPIQNNGTSGRNIAQLCSYVLEQQTARAPQALRKPAPRTSLLWENR